MKRVFFLICLLPLVGSTHFRAQAGSAQPDILSRSTQMIVVTTADWDTVEGRLQRFERGSARESWRSVGEPIAIVVGEHGLGWDRRLAAFDSGIGEASDPVKKEGDGKSPAGVFDLGTAFGYAAQPLPGLKLPYLMLTESTECVDDVNSKHYNRIVDRSEVAPDWNSSEHMRDVGEAYRWGIVVNYNDMVAGRDKTAPEPGRGSCIFLHIWHSRDKGTAGCTAMPQTDLETLLTWLDPAHTPVLVQLPEQRYHRLARRWKLPKLTDVPAH